MRCKAHTVSSGRCEIYHTDMPRCMMNDVGVQAFMEKRAPRSLDPVRSHSRVIDWNMRQFGQGDEPGGGEGKSESDGAHDEQRDVAQVGF